MKKRILFSSAIFVFALFSLLSCQKVVDKTSEKNDDPPKDELCQIGLYHNEILKNFITIRQQPSALSTSTEVDEYKKLMADYGSAVRLAYKKNPPSGNLDQWVGDVLSISISARQSKILDNILAKNMSLTNAINDGFGKKVVSDLISSYLHEIETTVNTYGGSVAIENKLTLLQMKYSGIVPQEDRTLVRWIHDVARGSHDYWNADYRNWNPRLTGRFWDSARSLGWSIVGSDISGAAEYFIGSKIGLIGGALSWKVGAAYAGLRSVIAGVETLIDHITTRSGKNLLLQAENVSQEEIYEAYLLRKKELGM